MLKKLWNYGRKDSLIRDSFILFTASSIVNVGAFIFHLIMGRFLGPANYGILGTLLTIVYIVNVPINVIQTTITKFVSQFKALNENNKISLLIRGSFRKLFVIGFFSTLFIILISPLIAQFLHISKLNIILLSPIILFSVLLPIVRGTLQGLQKFNLLGLNLILEIIFKLGLGIIFVYLGYKVNGAISAVVLSFLFPILLGLFTIKNFFEKKQTDSFDQKKIYNYTYPVLISLTLMSLLFTIDVFLVKHYFEEELAGFYVAASIIGKIIFFATFAISQVMFPKSVEKFSLNQSSKTILKKSLLLVSLLSVPITIFYFIFPQFVTLILFGNEYMKINNLLGIFGIAISLFSFSYLLVLYNLSISRINLIFPLIFFVILETLLIYFIHTTLLQVVLILTIIMLLVFIYLLFYTFANKKWSSSQ